MIDLELQIKALLAKLFPRGLIPGAAPLKMLIFYMANNLSPIKGGIWHGRIHFRGNGLNIGMDIGKHGLTSATNYFSNNPRIHTPLGGRSYFGMVNY